MSFTKTIFWNRDQSRLRAGWRLAIQLVFNISLALLILRLLRAHSGSFDPESLWGTVMLALVMVSVTLFSVWFCGRFLDRRRFSDFGLNLNRRAWWADFAFGLTLGIILPLALVLLGVVTDTVSLEPVLMAGFSDLSFGLAVLLSIVMYLCVGTFEEAGRAYHIRNLLEGTAQKLGLGTAAVIAVIGASIISVVMHSGNPAFLLFVLLATVVKGSSYLLTRRAAVAMGYHAAWDFVLIIIFGVGVQSGVDGATAFYIIQFNDAAWGSTVNYTELAPPTMLALLGLEFVALLLILGWTRLRYGDIKVRKDMTMPTLQR